MKSIDYQTKLLLRSKDLQNPKSFEDLGYIYFGPLLFNFFVWLKSEVSSCDKILFNSREGFFLEQIYKMFQEKYQLPESVYFKTSRKLSSMAACFTREDIYKTFGLHRYSGYLSNLLRDRFGICPKVEYDYVLDTHITTPFLDNYIDEILDKAKYLRNEYSTYISSIVANSKDIVMVDSGYQGTTQYYIQKAYGLTFKGRYFTFKGNEYLRNVSGFYDFKTTTLPKNIIFFESVFIDSVGSYIDIINGQFVTEKLEEQVQFFEEKKEIVLGAQRFIKDMLENNIDIESNSAIYPDYLFSLMCTKDFIKNVELMDIFYHDNYYTRDSIKKVIAKD